MLKNSRFCGLRPVTYAMRPFVANALNGGSGRKAGIAPPAGSEVHRSFRLRLCGETEGQQLADNRSITDRPTKRP